MQKSLIIIFLLCLGVKSYCQEISFVKDSIMRYYIESGYLTEHFKSRGKVDENKIRYGYWIDYEATKTFQHIAGNKGLPKQVFGKFLIHGEGEFLNGSREGKWSLSVFEDKTFKKIPNEDVFYKAGVKEGPFAFFFPNGNIAVEGIYINNKWEGCIKMYYENGKLYRRQYFSKSLAIGKDSIYYPNGNMVIEREYLNDTLNGNFKSYYENGKLEQSLSYKKGKEDGIYTYYYPNGQLWITKEYKNGLLMNVLNSYDSEGKLKDKGTLKNGDGTVIYYNEDGSTREIVTYKEGKKITYEK